MGAASLCGTVDFGAEARLTVEDMINFPDPPAKKKCDRSKIVACFGQV